MNCIVEWTTVGQLQYSIKDAFVDKAKATFAEAQEYCEFLAEDSALYEPRDDSTRTLVLADIKSKISETDDIGFWINAVRTTDDT